MGKLAPLEVKRLEDWAQALDKEQSFVVAMNLSDETIWKAMMHKFAYYRDKSNAYDRVPYTIDKMYSYEDSDWLLGDRTAKG